MIDQIAGIHLAPNFIFIKEVRMFNYKTPSVFVGKLTSFSKLYLMVDI